MVNIKFSDIKSKIEKALEEKLKENPINNESGFSLVEGFMISPAHSVLSKELIINSSTLPMVALVGDTSGRVYMFALKAILPEIEI